MTEHFSFFDAIQDSNGHYDREYNAQQFTDYFKSLVTTGVMKGAYNQLEVTANGSNMTTNVKSGVAFIEGRYYYNDALLQLTHDTEVIGLSRIDRIVVRMDTNTEARHVKTFIKKGVPNNNPVPPTLTQTPTVYEISLAQVRVFGGQTFIAQNAVTDERGKDIICPWAGSNILPSYDENALAVHINDLPRHVSPEDRTLWNYVKDYGLGNSVRLSNPDFNTLIKTGFNYSYGTNVANYPPTFPSGTGFLQVINNGSDDKYCVQVFYYYGDSNVKIASRVMINGVWGDWAVIRDLMPQLINASLQTGWANNDNSNPLRYYKDSMGVVHVYGRVRITATSAPFTITTLPVGYRPLVSRSTIAISGVSIMTNIEIDTNGTISSYIEKTVNNNVLVDISFPTTIT